MAAPVTSFLVLSGLLALVACLERVPVFQFRRAPFARPYLSTDALWYLVATVANLISTFVFGPLFARLALPGIASMVGDLPAAIRLVLALVVYDFVAFVIHVRIHRSDALWAVHKVHHSSLQLDGFAATRTHMFEHMVRNVPAQAALFALGMSRGMVAMTLVVYAAFAVYGHSNLRVGGRVLEAVFVTPRLHRLHHVPESSQRNFATVFTFWDRIFGSLEKRAARSDERTGVPGAIDDYPQRFVAAFREPLRERRRVPERS